MSKREPLREKIEPYLYYNADGDYAIEEIVDQIVDEIDYHKVIFEAVEKRLYALEHAEEIEADRRTEMTTTERCEEDNERI